VAPAAAGVLGSLSRGQLFDILAQLKLMAMQNQGQLRELLLGHPQLSKALLQAQVMLGGWQARCLLPAARRPPPAARCPSARCLLSCLALQRSDPTCCPLPPLQVWCSRARQGRSLPPRPSPWSRHSSSSSSSPFP
jgi:hypothetical protein